MKLDYRAATLADIPLLAAMNQRLIRDEGHRNRMPLPELEQRMADWLKGDYQAVIFIQEETPCGYALFRFEPDYIYLRHFYVDDRYRRQGIGRNALEWLRSNAWRERARIRLDVLIGNTRGIAFWKAVGFNEYCLTLEREDHDSRES